MTKQIATFAALAALAVTSPARADGLVDIQAWFAAAEKALGSGVARKTQMVDVRPAYPGEVVVTIIAGEGKETQSKPAQPGDFVVRNRCPQTGNEAILVTAATFAVRYEGPTGPQAADGWVPYRPMGVPMRFVVVPASEAEFRFTAPWGETMVARPGDAIVQDQKNVKDTYRIQKAAFGCTYEVITEPRPR